MESPQEFRVSPEALVDTHSQFSMEMIQRVAAGTDCNRAVVLGCGRCADIPMSYMLRRFNTIDLVDRDQRVLNALATQWPDADDQLHYHGADLTGVFTALSTRAQQITGRTSDPIEALDDLGEVLASTPLRLWNSDAVYDLVVCSAVLTQLQASVRKAIEEVFLNRFPESLAVLTTHRDWRTSAWRFARRLEDAFVAHLDTLVACGGVIYLSDTVRVAWLRRADEGTITTDGVWIATRTARLTDYLSPSAEIIAQREWTWLRQQQEGPYWGRLYEVQAVAYR